MSVSIYIEKRHNPLVAVLDKWMTAEGYTIKEKTDSADIIISLAYHDESDIVEMSTIGNILINYPGKKIIFLSWFHLVDDYNKYAGLFSPEKPTCVLMDTNQYRILQLPVFKKDMVNNVSEFAEIIQYEQKNDN